MGNDWFETDVEGFRVHWLPVLYSNSMTFTERIIAFFKFAFCSARKAASLQADVVFATSTPLTIAIPAVYVCKNKKYRWYLKLETCGLNFQLQWVL